MELLISATGTARHRECIACWHRAQSTAVFTAGDVSGDERNGMQLATMRMVVIVVFSYIRIAHAWFLSCSVGTVDSWLGSHRVPGNFNGKAGSQSRPGLTIL